MKENRQILYFLVFTALFAMISCTSENSSSADLSFDLKALKGTWVSQNDKDSLINQNSSVEIWEEVQEGILRGSDMVIFSSSDTVLIANLEIEKRDTSWFNVVTVNPDSNPQPVPFILHSSNENEMKFRNTLPGSPEYIGYKIKEENELLVYLESSSQDGTKKTVFHYRRLSN
ncbi:MAG: hypothetical protein SGI87_05305 [Flavobacteriales bacterium]|nr:hypothetical protein [Flavobacteriales bacterium]